MFIPRMKSFSWIGFLFFLLVCFLFSLLIIYLLIPGFFSEEEIRRIPIIIDNNPEKVKSGSQVKPEMEDFIAVMNLRTTSLVMNGKLSDEYNTQD